MKFAEPGSETAQPRPRSAALAFIFITVALDMLALGLIVPVLPKLVEDFLYGDTARAAEYVGLFGMVWAAMQFLFSPVLGAASDRFGRRPIILLSNFGLGLDYVVMAVAPTVWWLFAGRVISGITSASFSTASAYIADTAPPDKRAGSYGMISAAFGLGFVLGPALGGVFGSINPRLPFWIAAGLSLLNAMYGLLVLPESLPRDRREAFNWRRANSIGSIKLLHSHMELLALSSVSFLTSIAHEALPTTFVLYAMYRYRWNERLVGLAIASVGVCTAAVGAGMVQPLVARFGDRRVMLSGMVFNFAAFLVYGLAPTGLLFWTGLPVGSLGGLSNPPMQSLMTRRVKPTEQGQLQGALSSIRGIAFMIGPIIFTSTFAKFIGPYRSWHLPGAPYLLAGLIVMLSTIIAWRTTSSAAAQEVIASPQPAPAVE